MNEVQPECNEVQLNTTEKHQLRTIDITLVRKGHKRKPKQANRDY